MKLLLLALPLALAACVTPECVVMVNGQPVYRQCYDNNNSDGGNNRLTVTPDKPADDNGNGDGSDGGNDDNGNGSDGGNDDNGSGGNNSGSGDSNGGNSDDHDRGHGNDDDRHDDDNPGRNHRH